MRAYIGYGLDGSLVSVEGSVLAVGRYADLLLETLHAQLGGALVVPEDSEALRRCAKPVRTLADAAVSALSSSSGESLCNALGLALGLDKHEYAALCSVAENVAEEKPESLFELVMLLSQHKPAQISSTRDRLLDSALSKIEMLSAPGSQRARGEGVFYADYSKPVDAFVVWAMLLGSSADKPVGVSRLDLLVDSSSRCRFCEFLCVEAVRRAIAGAGLYASAARPAVNLQLGGASVVRAFRAPYRLCGSGDCIDFVGFLPGEGRGCEEDQGEGSAEELPEGLLEVLRAIGRYPGSPYGHILSFLSGLLGREKAARALDYALIRGYAETRGGGLVLTPLGESALKEADSYG